MSKSFENDLTHKIILTVNLFSFSMGIKFSNFKRKIVFEDNKIEKYKLWLRSFKFTNLIACH